MIVLPMAGLSSRFHKAGYVKPKYMLELAGRSVLSHVIKGFEGQIGQQRFLFICRDIDDTPAFILEECQSAGLKREDIDLVVLDHETSGQAETVYIGLKRAKAALDAPLTVFNIDTFRPGFRYPMTFEVGAVDGYLEVFRGEGDHWSFVRPDETAPSVELKVSEVTEKIRISDLCSTGLYYFKTVELFNSLYEPTMSVDSTALQGGERYIAPLYNGAISQGLDIRFHLIARAEVQFCGTPEEYLALVEELG